MPLVDSKPATGGIAVYSVVARTLHWLTLAMIAIQVPLGIFMVSYGERTNFAAPTAQMYDSHKLLGLAILAVIVARLIYRFSAGAPDHEPSLAAWQRVVSSVTHWAMYAMLVVVPMFGWLAVSYYGPFEPFGIKLPTLVGQHEPSAVFVFMTHKATAFLLIALIGMHVGAALMHYFVHKDNVLGRMWPALLRRRD